MNEWSMYVIYVLLIVFYGIKCVGVKEIIIDSDYEFIFYSFVILFMCWFDVFEVRNLFLLGLFIEVSIFLF